MYIYSRNGKISQLYSYKLNQISTRELNQTKSSTKDKHPLTKQLDLEVQIKISHLSTIHVLDRQNNFTEGAEKYFSGRKKHVCLSSGNDQTTYKR